MADRGVMAYFSVLLHLIAFVIFTFKMCEHYINLPDDKVHTVVPPGEI